MEDKNKSVTVAVVGLCSAERIARCLEVLEEQENAPPFDVIVVYSSHLSGMSVVRNRYPRVRMFVHNGEGTQQELASCALREASGEIILLTEDQCEPRHDWVGQLYEAQAPDRAAVGGVIELDDDASAVNWAYSYSDFFRYVTPVPAGPSSTLTVCNVAYRKAFLDEIAPLWKEFFHEPEIHDALSARGSLWLTPAAAVKVRRHIRLTDAVCERYAFGRLFGCSRSDSWSPGRRAFYIAVAPMLSLPVLGRLARKALMRPRRLAVFLRGLPALALLVLAWSWGEWLGYLTHQRPRALAVAPEVEDKRNSQHSSLRLESKSARAEDHV